MRYEEAIKDLDEIINNISNTTIDMSLKSAEKETLEKKHKWIKLKKRLMHEVSDETIRKNKGIPKRYSELINSELNKKGMHIKTKKIQV